MMFGMVCVFMQAPICCDVMQQSHWVCYLDSCNDEEERMEV